MAKTPKNAFDRSENGQRSPTLTNKQTHLQRRGWEGSWLADWQEALSVPHRFVITGTVYNDIIYHTKRLVVFVCPTNRFLPPQSNQSSSRFRRELTSNFHPKENPSRFGRNFEKFDKLSKIHFNFLHFHFTIQNRVLSKYNEEETKAKKWSLIKRTPFSHSDTRYRRNQNLKFALHKRNPESTWIRAIPNQNFWMRRWEDHVDHDMVPRVFSHNESFSNFRPRPSQLSPFWGSLEQISFWKNANKLWKKSRSTDCEARSHLMSQVWRRWNTEWSRTKTYLNGRSRSRRQQHHSMVVEEREELHNKQQTTNNSSDHSWAVTSLSLVWRVASFMRRYN